MDVGVHLPLMDFGGNPFSGAHLRAVASTSEQLGFTTLAANDHLLFGVPWLDGPTALASVIEASGSMTLATTVALPVLRGPVALAKALVAIDRLSDGRVVAAVGPGSSEADYTAAGIEFAERWARFDESLRVLRALLDPSAPPFGGRWYSSKGIDLAPAATAGAGPRPSGLRDPALLLHTGPPMSSTATPAPSLVVLR